MTRHRSLLWRASLASAIVLAITFLLLLITPVTVSAPIRAGEVVILAAGLIAMVAANVLLVRRALAPLLELGSRLDQIDIREPQRDLLEDVGRSPELASFSRSFAAMLDRLAEERRAGSRAAITAQERERLRIARALHDEAGQTLTAITLEIERTAEEVPPEQRERMRRLALQLHDGLDEIRRVAHELRPETLDDLGLVNALIALSARVARQGGIVVGRQISTDLPDLSEGLELVIYRVAQEALTNVLRHSGASGCVIALAVEGDELELSIQDDGQGMRRARAAGTVGIEGMRARALLVGGRLSIDSVIGEGTTVTLRVPLAEHR